MLKLLAVVLLGVSLSGQGASNVDGLRQWRDALRTEADSLSLLPEVKANEVGDIFCLSLRVIGSPAPNSAVVIVECGRENGIPLVEDAPVAVAIRAIEAGAPCASAMKTLASSMPQLLARFDRSSVEPVRRRGAAIAQTLAAVCKN